MLTSPLLLLVPLGAPVATQPMCRVADGERRTHLTCSNQRRPIHHLHMRKAGGTTMRENLHTACAAQWDQFEETEWGAYNWSAPPLDASRVVSLRPPLERLVSSYLFEGGIKQCWNYDTDGPIDLVGDEPNPAWSEKNWSFVQQCFLRHLQLNSGFDEFIANHSQSVDAPFVETGSRKYFGANYYLQKLLAGRASSSGCGRVDAAPHDWACHVEEAQKALLGSFDMVVLFVHGGMFALRAARPVVRVPCCLDAVPWMHLRKYSAEGNIHPTGWIDERIKDLTKALEQQIPQVYPRLWQQLAEANAADQSLFDKMVEYAEQAHRC